VGLNLLKSLNLTNVYPNNKNNNKKKKKKKNNNNKVKSKPLELRSRVKVCSKNFEIGQRLYVPQEGIFPFLPASKALRVYFLLCCSSSCCSCSCC
jgi:hypothetical protein